jgi:uncharacterized protein YciI
MPFFFARLIPPRPTFPFDISEVERAAMQQHAAYLRGLADSGQVIVAGPVPEGQGAWGLAVFEAASAGEARRLTDADPVVKSGLGFAYEILPMMSAMVGQRPAPAIQS